MKARYRRVLNYLYERKDWISAGELAEYLAVTTRSVQNYVREINRLSQEQLILSSYRGYRINRKAENAWKALLTESDEEERNTRISALLSRILTDPGINFFDLADIMYISESLANLELKKAEKILKKYRLTLVRKHNRLEITGTESDKRRLMAQLIREESNSQLGNLLQDQIFSSTYLSADAIDPKLLKQIRAVLCSSERIRFNDFGLQNVLIHILIMAERIPDHLLLPPSQNSAENDTSHPAYQMALSVTDLLSEHLGIGIPASELHYLALLISSNTIPIESEEEALYNPEHLMPQTYWKTIKDLISSLEDNFFLPKFNDDFIVRFAIHIMNWITRSREGMTAKNSLNNEVKRNYPLIYDMALYVAQQLSKQYDLTINDDECSFLVYHIGSYLLLHDDDRPQVNILIVYLNYNDFHLKALHLLERHFHGSAVFFLTPLSEFTPDSIKEKNIDLIITIGNFALSSALPVLHFEILPTERNLTELDKIIKNQLAHRKQAQLKYHFDRYIREDLFDFNLYAEDEFQMIRVMCEHCISLGLCDHTFESSVIERECLSSTSFMDGIAIPHSLEHNCREPFFYAIINELPMKWGEHQVQLILLIGTCPHDVKSFHELFDCLIKILSENDALPKLLKCSSYHQFLDTLTRLSLELEDS